MNIQLFWPLFLIMISLSGCANLQLPPPPFQIEPPPATHPAVQFQRIEPPISNIAENCPKMTDDMKLALRFPHQLELAEHTAITNCVLAFHQNARMAEIHVQVNQSNSLPPVEERLPTEPLLVLPVSEVGTYGGVLQGVASVLELSSRRHSHLVRYADDLQTIVPDIAKSWQWNELFTELTFQLRAGHKWSTGVPFTSADVAFWYYDLVRHEALYPQAQERWLLSGRYMEVVVVDELTFTLKFSGPMPGFLAFLATTPIQLFQPKHFLADLHLDYNPEANSIAQARGFDDWADLLRCYYHDDRTQIACPGTPTLDSHVLVEANANERVYLANPFFHQVDTAGQQLPYINAHVERVTASVANAKRALQNGDSDLLMGLTLAELPELSEISSSFTIQMASTGSEEQVYYSLNQVTFDNHLRRLFQDIRFRQALSLAIDRQAIIDTVYAGYARSLQATPGDAVTVSYITDEAATYLTDYDPAQANLLLDQMGISAYNDQGVRLSYEGRPIEIPLAYAPEAGPVEVHEMVQRNWADVGINLVLQPVSAEKYRAMTEDNMQAIAVWKYDHISLPEMAMFIPIQVSPPFVDGGGPRTGAGWEGWYFACVHLNYPVDSCAANSGRTPPDGVKHIWGITIELRNQVPGTPGWIEAGQKLVQNHQNNFYHIGIASDVKRPIAIHKRLRNVPEMKLVTADYYWASPYRAAQWFLSAE